MDQWQNDSPLPSSSTTHACQYTGLYRYHTPISSGARLAVSTAEIWDACNYRAIYSNQTDPNLYFPEAPARLFAPLLPPRKTQPTSVLFNQASTQAVPAERKKTVKLCHWLLEAKFGPNINTDRPLIETSHSLSACWESKIFFYDCLMPHSCLTLENNKVQRVVITGAL